MAGLLISRVDPVYPPEAKARRISGSVVLRATVGTSGAIEDLAIISGPPALTAAAVDAVRQWIYKPFQLNGSPVEVLTTVVVNFNPDAGAPR